MTSRNHASRDGSKLDAYPETILEFDGPLALRIDLRRELGPADRQGLHALGFDGGFAVLTAENPCGENAEDAPSRGEEQRREARNERRTSALETALRGDGILFRRLDGVSPDGQYREACLAARLDRAAAVALARRFDQLALFWFDGCEFWLLPAEADGEPRRLPERA